MRVLLSLLPYRGPKEVNPDKGAAETAASLDVRMNTRTLRGNPLLRANALRHFQSGHIVQQPWLIAGVADAGDTLVGSRVRMCRRA